MTVQRLGQGGFASVGRILVLTAFILANLAGSATAAEGSGAKPRLLLLPIVVHSSEDPEYLRDGLSDMLAARFDRIGALELVRSSSNIYGAANLDDALKLARKAGVDYVLYGSFTRFGKGASLDVQCAPVSGVGKQREPLREIFVHSGSIGEIIPDLDELAGKVSRFARGEDVSRIVAGSPSGIPRAGTGVESAAVEALTVRIEALEAALKELLERGTEAGTDG